ncbi:MAG: hypothetical protein INH41_00490 [Myxococcaceae bacterium]|jgi:hypothetical protein|nr:hypothetical protein [Myxococcaceae bacterium]MCA3010854.1 hypothetical protein [Myxococcaceae bacterium]
MRATLAALLGLLARAGLADETTSAVVVAVDDLPAGAVVTASAVTQREVPDTFVTRAMVRPALRDAVLGRRTRFPILAGEPLRWAFFEPGRRVEACDAQRAEQTAEAQVSRHREVLRARAAPARPGPRGE